MHCSVIEAQARAAWGYSVSVVQENVVADSASHQRDLRVAEQLVVAMIRPRFAIRCAG